MAMRISEIERFFMGDSAKVIGMRGGASAPLGNGAEPDIIAALEAALDQARRGELRAVGLVLVKGNLEIGTVARNPCGHRHLLVAGCSYLQHDLMAADD